MSGDLSNLFLLFLTASILVRTEHSRLASCVLVAALMLWRMRTVLRRLYGASVGRRHPVELSAPLRHSTATLLPPCVRIPPRYLLADGSGSECL